MPGWDGTGTPENFLIVRVMYSGLITLFNKVHCSIFRADEPAQVCGLEFDNVIFFSFEQKFGKPKRKWREEINHSHAHDLQRHERHHPLIDIQQFPLRHDSLDIVGR